MAKSERTSAPRAPAVAQWVVEALVWKLLTWGIWLLSLSTVDTEDLFVGGLCALGCGLAAPAARRVCGARWHPDPSALRAALLLPVAIVVDCVAVLLSPWRRSKGAPSVTDVDIGAGGENGSPDTSVGALAC